VKAAMLPSPLNHCPLIYQHPHQFAFQYMGVIYRIILNEWRKLGIWHHSIECPVDLLRDGAMDFQRPNLAFQPTRLHKTLKLGSIGKKTLNFEFHLEINSAKGPSVGFATMAKQSQDSAMVKILGEGGVY
jgi:hypothetical protein